MSNDYTLYLSGPMTGIPEHNFPLFNAVAHKLRAANAVVYNPAEHFSGRVDLPRHEYMAEDFRKLLEVANADTPVKGIVLLPGWTGSKGARAEVVVAHELGLQFFAWQDERLQRTTLAETFTDTAKPVIVEGVVVATGETRITDPKTGGQKGQKDARFDLIPTEPLRYLALVYGMGAKKYADDNWRKGYDWKLSYGAMQRHLNAFWGGEDLDPESKLPHLAHAMWHCATLLWFSENYKDGDTRATRRNIQA